MASGLAARVAAGLIWLTFGPAFAQDVTIAERVAMADAVRAAGCFDTDAVKVRDASGLTGERAIAVLDSLTGDRLGELDPRFTVSVSPGLCGKGPGADARQVLLDAARLYRCRLAEADFNAHIAKVGADPVAINTAAAAMIGQGQAALEGREFVVAPEVCALKPTHPDLRTAWIAAFREGDCRVDLTRIGAVAMRHGLPRQEDPVMSGWLKDGTVQRSSQSLYLDPSLCMASEDVPRPDAATMISALAASGCSAGGSDLALEMESRGVGAEVASHALMSLMLDGTVTVEGGRITLSAAACQASRPADLVGLAEASLDETVSKGVEEVIRRAGCRLELRGIDTEEEVLRLVRLVAGLPPSPRRFEGDDLLRSRIRAVTMKDTHFRRDGGVLTFEGCMP